jgi:hypothetical protein
MLSIYDDNQITTKLTDRLEMTTKTGERWEWDEIRGGIQLVKVIAILLAVVTTMMTF